MEKLLDQITRLINQPAPADGGPHLEQVERVLTDGYAHALALEAERWRLERRIGEVAAEFGSGDIGGKTKELSALTERLTSADGELESLRGLLGRLRDQASVLRAALMASF